MMATNGDKHTGLRNHLSQPLEIGVPVRATVLSDGKIQVFDGRLEAIGEGQARIFFDQPLPEGTELSVLVEFKDRNNREIRFQYTGRIAFLSQKSWHEVAVDFDEGVSISGKDARELLSELFPEGA